jgi:Protein of unknown function (DUF4031)
MERERVAIFVDEPRWPAHGTEFAHVVSDASLDELHAFVARLPLARPLRFHRDHYDVPRVAWPAVVGAGAHVVNTKELVTRLRDAGLRARRHEKSFNLRGRVD